VQVNLNCSIPDSYDMSQNLPKDFELSYVFSSLTNLASIIRYGLILVRSERSPVPFSSL
jgi:hypothetical protein